LCEERGLDWKFLFYFCLCDVFKSFEIKMVKKLVDHQSIPSNRIFAYKRYDVAAPTCLGIKNFDGGYAPVVTVPQKHGNPASELPSRT